MRKENPDLQYVQAFCIGHDAGIVDINKSYQATLLIEAMTIDSAISGGRTDTALINDARRFKYRVQVMHKAGLLSIKRIKKGVK